VIVPPAITLDARDESRIVRDLLRGRGGYVPEWAAGDGAPATAVARIAGRYLATIVQRLNQAPAKARLAFLDTLGIRLVPAQPARTPLVFVMAKDAAAGRIAAGSAASAPAPAGRTDPITFETERAIGAMTGRIQQVVSLWPGRDEYIDHSAAFLAGQPFRLFEASALEGTEHAIYVGHGTLLALKDEADVQLEVELRQPSSEHLTIRWQYWNGTVWRDFLDVKPACRPDSEPTLDSTDGLQHTGRIQLKASCAEAKPHEIFGITSCWIRGRLDEPLPPDPSSTLPEIEGLRIGTTLAAPLLVTLTAGRPEADGDLPADNDRAFVRLQNVAGAPVSGATVMATSEDGTTTVTLREIAAPGVYRSDAFDFAPAYRFRVRFDGETGLLADLVRVSAAAPIVDLVVTIEGVEAKAAFADVDPIDLSKPFYPLGQQPQPGATFYFQNDDVLGKPGAAVRLYLAATQSPLDQTSIVTRDFDVTLVRAPLAPERLEHVVSWEYWNSRQWVPFMRSSGTPRRDFTATEILDFTVPLDVARTMVNDQEAFWFRAKLLRGGFGFKARVTWLDARENQNEFTYVVQQPPALAALRVGYAWQNGPSKPDACVTFNDFQYVDRSDAVRWPGQPFPPFSRVADVTPAVYVGIDAKPPVDRIGLYLDIDEERAGASGPALRWEYFDGAAWRFVAVEDETERFRSPGIVSFLAPPDLAASPRFGRPLYWIRARLKEDGPPGEATVLGLFANAVWAAERRTIRNSPLGTSDGTANQVFRVAESPILPGEILEVREVSGARAPVEWRQIVLDVTGGDQRVLASFEQWLALEGPQSELTLGAVRIKRDRLRRVADVWVRWQVRPHLYSSGPTDRYFALDRADGRVAFGDGVLGRVPPLGAVVSMREFAAGGGSIGNVKAGAVNQLVAEIAGVEQVFNARAAEGGADGETLEALATRGPATVRHRGRAIAVGDYETMAREASPAIGFVRAVPTLTPAGRPLPGWVTLVVIPYSEEPRPRPSSGLRHEIEEYLAARAPAGPAAAGRIQVIGPDYFPVDVSATVAPLAASAPGDVEQRARAAIARFLHPLLGGPAGRGWELGRDIFLSDLAAVLEQVDGVDYVEELALLRGGVPFGERVPIAHDRMAVAGTILLTLRTARGETA
jgi:hypothetical protein